MSDTLRVSNLHFGNAASNNNQPQMGFTSVGIGSTTNYGFLQFFGTSNTLCWTANGTVGIGTTNPTATLQVNGTGVNNTTTLTVSNDTNSNTGYGAQVLFNNYSGNATLGSIAALRANNAANFSSYMAFSVNTADALSLTERMRILNNGFVGISTTSPLARLTVRNGYGDGDTGGLCIDASDGSVYNMRLSSFTPAASQVSYRFGVNNLAASLPNTLVLAYNGNVGIGTDNPQVPLHIPRSSTISVGAGGYYFSTGTSIIGFAGNGALATSIRVSDAIVTGASFIAASDIRVKKNIQPVLNSLQIIDQLNIVSYDKIDYISTGVDAGIIAQDIQDILPRAISKHASFIPNIYQCATYEDINDNEIRVDVTCNDKDVKEGGRVQLKIVKGDKEESYESSLHQLTGTSFVIKKWSDFSNDHKVFVYGTEVDDFLSVDKEQIGMMAAAGVKELHQVVKEQQAEIVSLQSQLVTVLARIAEAGIM